MTTEELLAKWEAEAKKLESEAWDYAPGDCPDPWRWIERSLTLIQALREYEKAIEFYAEEEYLPGPTESYAGPGWYEGDDGKKAREASENVRKILECE